MTFFKIIDRKKDLLTGKKTLLTGKKIYQPEKKFFMTFLTKKKRLFDHFCDFFDQKKTF